MDAWMGGLSALFDSPAVGLGGLFVSAFLSATLLPLGSEALLYAVLDAEPRRWPAAVAVATVGNTLGGAFTWWMGRGAKALAGEGRGHARALRWLQRLGPKACLLAWLPVVGDALCAVAGWLRLPLPACVLYMAVGKGLRYLALTALFLGPWMSG